MKIIKFGFFKNIDWVTFFAALMLSVMGLSVIYSFGDSNLGFYKQLISLAVAVSVFFVASNIEIYFLKNSRFISLLYFILVGMFVFLVFLGSVYSGAQS